MRCLKHVAQRSVLSVNGEDGFLLIVLGIVNDRLAIDVEAARLDHA